MFKIVIFQKNTKLLLSDEKSLNLGLYYESENSQKGDGAIYEQKVIDVYSAFYFSNSTFYLLF
jgi:hypothetical protein